jgi:hypothetical protein
MLIGAGSGYSDHPEDKDQDALIKSIKENIVLQEELITSLRGKYDDIIKRKKELLSLIDRDQQKLKDIQARKARNKKDGQKPPEQEPPNKFSQTESEKKDLQTPQYSQKQGQPESASLKETKAQKLKEEEARFQQQQKEKKRKLAQEERQRKLNKVEEAKKLKELRQEELRRQKMEEVFVVKPAKQENGPQTKSPARMGSENKQQQAEKKRRQELDSQKRQELKNQRQQELVKQRQEVETAARQEKARQQKIAVQAQPQGGIYVYQPPQPQQALQKSRNKEVNALMDKIEKVDSWIKDNLW